MAGAGYKLFNTGDVLTAAQVNTYLQEQAVMRFANSTARTTALSGVLAEGMMSYLDDTNSVEVYNGSAWVSIGSTGDITGVTAGTGISGGGTSGDVTITNSMATAIDAKGDLVAGTGADAFSRLAVGTNGFALVAASGESTGLKWATPFIGCLLYLQNASVSFTQNVTKIFDGYSESEDTDAFHSTSTNTSRVTIPTGLGGLYRVYGTFNSTTADYKAKVYLYKNGSVLQEYGIYNGENTARPTPDRPALSFINYIDFVAGDYLEYGIQSNWPTASYTIFAQLAVERIAS